MATERANFWQTPIGLGILGRCPRCQKGHIFNGFLALADHCEVCGLDYSFADPADGPAFFAMSIASFPVVGFAAWLELAVGIPLWLNMLLTIGLIIGSCCALLRPIKGWLVCSQYMNKAEQARLDETGDGPAGRP
ncbi:DUF983 domain-containing protein [Indioceanicola profundi]|uniref:DUF983 domain-containing protein n=1 Tax=Indioceanicola profundi TaxID=2220096 RepID=UPI000E6AD65E|nr:DUF983 domain-containing protein [Indioceanicola profundi]